MPPDDAAAVPALPAAASTSRRCAATPRSPGGRHERPLVLLRARRLKLCVSLIPSSAIFHACSATPAADRRPAAQRRAAGRATPSTSRPSSTPGRNTSTPAARSTNCSWWTTAASGPRTAALRPDGQAIRACACCATTPPRGRGRPAHRPGGGQAPVAVLHPVPAGISSGLPRPAAGQARRRAGRRQGDRSRPPPARGCRAARARAAALARPGLTVADLLLGGVQLRPAAAAGLAGLARPRRPAGGAHPVRPALSRRCVSGSPDSPRRSSRASPSSPTAVSSTSRSWRRRTSSAV